MIVKELVVDETYVAPKCKNCPRREGDFALMEYIGSNGPNINYFNCKGSCGSTKAIKPDMLVGRLLE